MIAAEKIVKDLIEKGVVLYLEAGALKYKARKGALSQSDFEKVGQNKESITQYLNSISQSAQAQSCLAPDLKRQDRPTHIPLSFAQQRLWFIDQMGAGSKQYNMTGRYVHTGAFNSVAFERAIKCLLDRHEALRTCIRSQNGEPEQVVLQEYALPIAAEDLSALVESDKTSIVEKMFNDEVSAIFDFSTDLMIRVRVIKLAELKHVIFYTLHHIASDGWSLSIFYNELSLLYKAFCENKENPLPPLAVQYPDYALWQRGWLKGDLLSRQLSYWHEQLAGVPLVHCLPTDKVRPDTQSYSGKMFYQKFGRALTERINTLCEQHEVTSFMFLQTAFAVLLGRYSGETDIVIGTPIAGRTHAELESMIGFFVNSLGIRTDLSENSTFADLLAKNKKTIIDAYAHQDVPFEMLVEELRVARDVSFNPVFQIIFAGQTNERGDLEFGDAQEVGADNAEVDYSTYEMATRFDLEAHLTERGGHFTVQWIFADALFEESSTVRLAKNFEVLVEGIVDSLQGTCGTKTIRELPYLSQEERRMVLHQWDASEERRENHRCIHQHFESQVSKSPSNVAITFDGASVTYEQLNTTVNQLAHLLISKGVRPETKVGVLLERSAEMVLSVLAILKAGGAYVPIDPRYPKQRIDYIIEDSGVDLILTQSNLLAMTGLREDRLVVVDDAFDVSGQQSSLALFPADNIDPREIGLSPDNLAYVIYTSGSTGNPKGVMVEHKNVSRLFGVTAEDFRFNEKDVWTLFHSISFDFSVWEIWGALFFGGRLVVVPQEMARSTHEFYKLLVDQRVTVLNQTPSAFYLLAAEDDYQQSDLALRYVIFGGEALDTKKLKTWVSRRGDSFPKLINMYGITETTVHVTYREIVSHDVINPKASVIGRPLADLKVYLFDQQMVPTPIGVTAEMYVGGDGVSRGYLNREELTASRFIDNPYNSGERLYRTGDLARFTHDGELEYIGRIDEQVKIRGFRIELGEIESALSTSDSVDNAVVSVHSTPDGDKMLVAHVCPSASYLHDHAKVFNSKDVAEWAGIFDSTYQDSESTERLGSDFSGWNCSYTDLPIPLPQMEEWLEKTVRRISSFEPKHLLEIGCGTGLLLYRYAAQCESVSAIDLSQVALSTIQTEVIRRGWSHVNLFQADALQLSNFAKNSFDTVIINSVVQYFPNGLYLAEMLNQLISLVRPGGKILFGDIRNLDLLHVHDAIVERDHLTQPVEVNELVKRVQRRLLLETELCISPSYFDRLQQEHPELARIDVHVKRGLGDNEMMRYRYDVVITKSTDSGKPLAVKEAVSWHAYDSLDAIRSRLQSAQDVVIGFHGVPNFRLSEDLKFTEGLANWKPTRKIYPSKTPGVLSEMALKSQSYFEQLLCFAESLGCNVGITWSQTQTGYLDLIFSRGALPPVRARSDYKQHHQVNYPHLDAVGQELSAELIVYLKSMLSDYMVPSLFIVIEKMPINANGKVDKKALPVPQENDWHRDEYVAPKNEMEEKLCQLWQTHLNIKQVGTRDNFFLLGGHSLLATRLVSAIRQAFNVEMPLSSLFESPTVSELAAALVRRKGDFVLPPITTCRRDGNLPLSFSQQRLWFIDQFGQGSRQYNMSGSFPLFGTFDGGAFERALKALADRHEIVRTRYEAKDGQPYQVIDSEFLTSYSDCDLIDRSQADGWNEVEKIREELASKPFDLERDHMLRVVVGRLADNVSVVIYSIHHIACDGWSIRILQQDLTMLYNAQVEGKVPSLPLLPVQYADVSVWQRDWLKDEVLSTQTAYWKEALRNLPALHSLPLDKIRPAAQTFEGMGFRTAFSADLRPKLLEICRKYDVTLFMLLHTAFTVLLAKCSRQKDIVVGTPISGRIHADAEGLIGFFVNSLILRTNVESTLTFEALLKQNKTALLDAYAHQHVPFEALVEELSPGRELAYNALYQIVFSIQSDELLSADGGGSDAFCSPDTSASESAPITTRTDLEVHASETGGHLSMIWVYNVSLFSDASVRQMASSYQALVENIVEYLLAGKKDTVTVQNLQMLSGSQWAEQLAMSQRYAGSSTDQHPMYQQFEQKAAILGDAVAVLHDNESLTYRALNERSNKLARLLLSKGVKPGDCVLLLLSPSSEMVMSMLAVQKIGAAYIPLDASYPQARTLDIIEDCGCRLIISEQGKGNVDARDDICVIQLKRSDVRDELNAFPSHNLPESEALVHAESLAYVLYTSGSTGRPKGVMVSQGNLAHYLEHSKKYLKEDVRCSVVSTAMTFDATVTSLWTPLCVGISIEIVPQDEKLIDRLVDFVGDGEERLLFKLTPSHLRALLGCHLLEGSRSVQHVFVIGGEKLSTDLLARWQQLYPNATFINEYGPTETTVGCSSFEVNNRNCVDERWLSVPIGEPIDNTELLVLDSALNLVPPGVQGELFIAGKGVSQGYINDPVKSAKSFLPNPYSDVSGKVMYRTGDIVRWLPDGNLDFIGRNDDQVKVRGFRIELGEIEAQLKVAAECEQCVVLAVGCSDEEKHLAAFMLRPAGEPEIHVENLPSEELKARLAKHLPSYMIPLRYIWVTAIPLTTNGKVDHKSLLSKIGEGEVAGGYVAPRNQTEAVMCEIWQDTLKLDRVGVWDNFFSIGGHSLIATRLISAIRQRFNVEITLPALFAAPCVAELSEKIGEYADRFVLPAIVVSSRQQALPLSFSQQRLWFIDQLGEGSAHYNMTDSFIIKGSLNGSALEFAFNQILKRHEALRTKFETQDGATRQVVLEDVSISLWVADVSCHEKEQGELALHALLDEVASQPFDLSRDLLLRGGYVLLDADTTLVHYATHHIVSDGRSMEILKRELKHLYDSFGSQSPNSLRPLPIQYADYAIWQRQWLQGNILESQVGYWKKQLEGIPQLHSIPLDKPRPATQSFKGRCFTSMLSQDIMSRVRAQCEQADVTLFMFLHTAFAVLLGRYANQSDIVMGIATEGRTHKDVEDLVGFFVNALVLRTDLSEDPSFRQLLQTNKQNVLNAYASQDVPFEMLVEELRPERDLSHNPIFQVMFAVHRLEEDVLETSGLSSSADLSSALMSAESTASTTRSDLQVHVNEIGNVVAVMWNYNESLFEQATLRRLADGYAALLGSILAELEGNAASGVKGRSISQLNIIGESNSKELAAMSQGRISSPLPDVSFIRQLELQAAKTPDRIAAILGDDSMTYRELNEQANQLARYLCLQGITSDDVVAMCVEPSLELLVGSLGVLKCGAAYVPLDPKLPLSRLEWVLGDCNAAMVLTQQALMMELTFEGRRVLPIDPEFRDIMMATYATENLDKVETASQQNLAYIIYTSGSTGTPKGVKVSCQAMQSYCEFSLDNYYDDKLDGAIAVTGYNVDMTVPSLFLPLIRGGHVRFLEDGHVLEQLSQHLKRTDKNYLLRMTPSHALGLLDLLGGDVRPSNHHSFILGGEVLHLNTVTQLSRVFCNAIIMNHYGPTEAVVGCVLNKEVMHEARSRQALAQTGGKAPIGRPMDNVHLYVVDKHGALTLPGAIGELMVSSSRLSSGYLNDERMTSEKFVSTTLPNQLSAQAYKTGDLVRWLPNGNLDFIGRQDDQVQLRGFRIELGDIDAALKTLADVRESTAVIKQLSETKHCLVAFIVPKEAVCGEDDLSVQQKKGQLIKGYREYLSRKLPDYMVPSVFVFLDELPKTKNGKLDTKRLPAPLETDLQGEEYVAPATEIERSICLLWQEILELGRVGTTDNFFTIGGHSLLGTRLISAIRQQYDVELPVRMLFEFPTVSDLANIVETELLNKEITTSEAEEFVL